MEIMKIKKIPHLIFKDKTEFENYFLGKVGTVPPLVENWKEGQEGEWVLADDGGVVQILKRANTNKDKVPSRAWVRTVVGTFPINKYKDKMDTDTTLRKYPDGRYRFGGGSDRTWQIIKNRERPTKKEKLFAMYIIAGHSPEESYKRAYKYNGDIAKLKFKAWTLIKQERIMTQVREEIREAAEKAGVGQDSVFKYLKRFIEDEGVPSNQRLDAIEKLAKYLDVETEGNSQTGFTGFFGSMQQRKVGDRLKKLEGDNKIEDADTEDIIPDFPDTHLHQE